MSQNTPRRVLALAPMPAEKCAYALARYSRSADSIRQSLEWVGRHDSHKFLESFYFQYGHASIADLGHVALCFEGISELAATEIEDEQLWDGQARSSRYQDFSKSGMVTPPELSGEAARAYHSAGERLLAAYGQVRQAVLEHLAAKLPRPGDLNVEAYERNLAARAFDVARYLLFLGVPTSVGQVTSIRTLERQVRRLKASQYRELHEVGGEIAAACAEVPGCALDGSIPLEPIAPTLAKHVSADAYLQRTREDLRQWAAQNLPPAARPEVPDVDLLKPPSPVSDIVATLLYPATDRPYRELYELASGWSEAVRREVLDLAVRWRGRGDDLLRAFRGGPYVFDIIMDAGAWRDLHRHRRCHQFRQAYTTGLGYETPAAISGAGVAALYDSAMQGAIGALGALPEPAAHYLIPFAARSRFLFKMDFAEAEYIARLRSGLKGHFSYRDVAWKMKEAMDRVEPELGRLIQATPPWMEDPLRR